MNWSGWRSFPDPMNGGILVAPFGPGCYELRQGEELVAVGCSRNVAKRMSCLLPPDAGGSTEKRRNEPKQAYVRDHLPSIEYRTLACSTKEEAEACERAKQASEHYLFPR
jgi:hypothetical protein